MGWAICHSHDRSPSNLFIVFIDYLFPVERLGHGLQTYRNSSGLRD